MSRWRKQPGNWLGNNRGWAILAIVIIVLLILIPTWVRYSQTPWQPKPTIVTQAKQVYQLYIPFMFRPSGLYGMGVAGTPDTGLRADFFMGYQHCNAPCIPMNKGHSVPQGWCAPIELLFNEPTSEAPTISVTDAITISQAIRQECPSTWLVVGNFIQYPWGLQWMKDYIAGGGIYNQVGFHSYCQFAQDCINYIEYVKTQLPVPLCLTEFNTTTNDAENFRQLLEYVQHTMDCAIVFAACWSCENGDPVLDLQNAQGLTPKGAAFAERQRALP